MPRNRIIKPEQTTDENFVECSDKTRLFVILVRNFADDNGIFEVKPRTLKMQIFPGDDNIDMEQILEEFFALHHGKSYTSNGKKYALIRNFHKHQTIPKPGFQYPVPNQCDTSNEPVTNQYDTGYELNKDYYKFIKLYEEHNWEIPKAERVKYGTLTNDCLLIGSRFIGDTEEVMNQLDTGNEPVPNQCDTSNEPVRSEFITSKTKEKRREEEVKGREEKLNNKKNKKEVFFSNEGANENEESKTKKNNDNLKIENGKVFPEEVVIPKSWYEYPEKMFKWDEKTIHEKFKYFGRRLRSKGFISHNWKDEWEAFVDFQELEWNGTIGRRHPTENERLAMAIRSRDAGITVSLRHEKLLEKYGEPIKPTKKNTEERKAG